jgi:hypothetical protein
MEGKLSIDDWRIIGPKTYWNDAPTIQLSMVIR